MIKLKDHYNYFFERIRLGSVSIKAEDFPFSTFLIGYYVGRNQSNIDQLFELLDIMEELAQKRLLSSLLKKQILTILEDFPSEIRKMILVLLDYKSGKGIDIIKWIESFYNDSQSEQRQDSIQEPVRIEAAAIEGTLELDHQSNTQELKEQNKRDQNEDIEFARKLQEEFDKEQIPVDDDVPCEICYCGLYDGPFDSLDNCGHLFHTNCMAEAFKTNILSNNFPIICPNEECKKEVTEGDLKRILDKPLFQKYQNHTLKAYAQGHGDSISWCPTANCTYMFFFTKDDSQRFVCEQCKKEYCLNCRVEWHKEMTCKEYKVSTTMSEEDQQFLAFAKGKKFKQCPKCKFWVEKNQGCDHMTCKCKFEFCYKCGGVYMKCECMEEMRRLQERRREQMEQRRRRKEERKRTMAEKAVSRGTRKEEKERRQQLLRKQREQRDNRATRSRKRN